MSTARFTIPISALFFAGFAGAAMGVETNKGKTIIHESRDSDAYVLSMGKSFLSTNASLEKMQTLRKRFGGDFLWVRRERKAFLVRDPATLRQARTLFDPLRTLEPDHAALERFRAPLESREAALEREQELLDRDSDRLADERGKKATATREDLERRQRALAERMRALEREQEQFDALENALDEKEEALESYAEGELWRLIDSSITRGVARPIEEN